MSQVFTTESCGTCNGTGWPEPEKAVPCSKCQGLGVRIKPTSDPFKTIE
jgi:DnaJ-class molecular chaperone